MIKKLTVVTLILLVMLIANSCTIKKENNDSIVSSTKQVTLIRNSFKDALPKFNFDNEVNDIYVDGISYKFTVKCTQNQFEKYIQKVKKAGFIINVSDGTNYYSAQTEDCYSAEITYINEIMTVYCKKI